MKIAVHMYFTERLSSRHVGIKKLTFNTQFHGTYSYLHRQCSRSPKTKYHNQKHLPLTYNETHLTVANQQAFTFDNCVQKRQLNNPCNGVPITTVQTLQGDVTVNQMRTP